MTPLSEAEIRTSFVNCSQGEAKRLRIPVGLVDTAWDTLDFLGWRDPGAPAAAHLVTERRGKLTGLVMRLSTDRRATGRQNMCALCSTVHSTTDVALMVAPRRLGPKRQHRRHLPLHRPRGLPLRPAPQAARPRAAGRDPEHRGADRAPAGQPRHVRTPRGRGRMTTPRLRATEQSGWFPAESPAVLFGSASARVEPMALLRHD